MTRWKTPDYIRKMRDEGKGAASVVQPWYKSLLHLAWGAIQYVFGRLCKWSVDVWVWLKGPWWPRAKSVPAALLTFAGLYSLLSSFVTFSIGEPFDPAKPLSAPITITNTSSVFTLININVGCMVATKYQNPGILESGNSTSEYMPTIPELLRGNQDTLSCLSSHFPREPIRSEDITLTVSYKPAVYLWKWWIPIWPIPKHSAARFIAGKTNDGKFHWLPYGLKDPDLP